MAVLDLDLPDGHGAELIRALRQASPGARVLVLTASAIRTDLARAVAAGADGLLHKTVPINEIIAAVRRVHAGTSVVERVELERLLQETELARAEAAVAQAALAQLTKREREVLQALAEGLSDQALAAGLRVSKETIGTHMRRLLTKLGVESRLQAVTLAAKQGVITFR